MSKTKNGMHEKLHRDPPFGYIAAASSALFSHLLGHDVLDKLFGIMNHKAPSVWLPRNNVRKSFGTVGLVEDMVQLEGKGHQDSAPFALEGQYRRRGGSKVVIVVLHKMAAKVLGGV